MQNNKLEPYPSLLLRKRDIDHSRLYNLEPIGIGTFMKESLISYLTRLAELHCISPRTLVIHEIAPLMEKEYLVKRGKDLFIYPKCINGDSDRTQLIVNILEYLTGRSEIRQLTLLYWSKVLSNYQIFRDSKAWCPYCYQEWLLEGKPVYDPLIWSFNVVQYCNRHNQKLTTLCPHCRKEIPTLSFSSKSGFCNRCKQWLGKINSDKFSNKIIGEVSDFDKWIVNEIGTVISYVPVSGSPPDTKLISRNISYISKKIPGRNKSLFLKNAGINDREFRRWVKGDTIPRINSLLELCYITNIDLIDIITEKVKNVNFRIIEYQKHFANKGKIKRVDHTKVQMMLEKILSDENPAPSLTSVSKRLNYSIRTLRKHFPLLCDTIASKYKMESESIVVQKRILIKNDIKNCVNQIMSEGCRLTLHNVMSRSQTGLVKYCRFTIDTLKELLCELELS